mmetsp:Transcript_18336/g.25499  ORF Transcript_18336/g.25499 Transcript_18336/m.25499 type:complete len:107 (+) Transcript_18336:1777-2097(+)
MNNSLVLESEKLFVPSTASFLNNEKTYKKNSFKLLVLNIRLYVNRSLKNTRFIALKKKRKIKSKITPSIKLMDNIDTDKDFLICKDFKVYGTCSYGNTCKFGHIRN